MAEFAYKDLKVILMGREIAGLMGLKWTYKVEKSFLHARGSKAHSLQSGNETVEGTVKILQSEYVALVKAIKSVNPTYKVTDVAFDLIENYGNGLTAVTNIILGAQIEEFNGGLDQNEANQVIELKFKALDVQEGA